MDLESSATTDGSGVANERPEELDDMLDRRHPRLRTRLAERTRGLGRQVGDTVSDMSGSQKALAVTLIVGAAAAAWRGPRAVASLRGRNQAPVGKLSQLRFWRR